MLRYDCHILNKKNLCPKENPIEWDCEDCSLLDLYKGKRPVPESNVRSNMEIYESHMVKPKNDMDRLYDYLMEHSKVFRNLGMDQQGELLIKMEEAIKNKKFI